MKKHGGVVLESDLVGSNEDQGRPFSRVSATRNPTEILDPMFRELLDMFLDALPDDKRQVAELKMSIVRLHPNDISKEANATVKNIAERLGIGRRQVERWLVEIREKATRIFSGSQFLP